MMFEKLMSEIKQAMLAKDNMKRDCLRAVVSEIKNQTVNAGKEITDEICLKVIQKSVKQHNDSITQFKSAGREDLVEKESSELKVLEAYLPKMLSVEETLLELKKILEKVEPIKKNTGIIMKQLPHDVDKRVASKLLQGLLK